MAKRKAVIFCDVCGASTPSGSHDFISFHCLMLCSPDCRDEYRVADEDRLVRKELAAKAEVPATR